MTNKVIVQKTVGQITVRGEASSDQRDISMQDLLNIATAATGEEQIITGRPGVDLTVVMTGPDAPAEPTFTPADPLQDAVDAMQRLQTENNQLIAENNRLQHRIEEYQRRLKVIREHA